MYMVNQSRLKSGNDDTELRKHSNNILDYYLKLRSDYIKVLSRKLEKEFKELRSLSSKFGSKSRAIGSTDGRLQVEKLGNSASNNDEYACFSGP